MIYLQKTNFVQTVRIPANGVKESGVVTLELRNTIDRGPGVTVASDQSVRLVDADGRPVVDADGLQIILADVAATTALYYVISVAIPETMPEGEYEYTARVGDTVVSCGLAIVGDPKATVTSYDKPVQYEQYIAN